MDIQRGAQVCAKVLANVQQVIHGKDLTIQQALACWLAGGHLLIEDVPGTGKTMLARAISVSVNVQSNRVQFTPELLPSDISGSSIYSQEKKQFVFIPGPLFTTVLLADELNRGTPRTQAALLQAMAEGQCTADNKTYLLPKGFFVIATQNPVEQHGTFPLPEAQLDRFMMRISVGYPNPTSEKQVIQKQLLKHPIDEIQPVVDQEEWFAVRELVKSVEVSDAAVNYAVQVVSATREHPNIALGASPRASIALIRCAQAIALMQGDGFVKPDTIKLISPYVVEHRLALTTKARLERVTTVQVVQEILSKVAVPIRKAS
jgi:MoxR-like ATPase